MSLSLAEVSLDTRKALVNNLVKLAKEHRENPLHKEDCDISLYHLFILLQLCGLDKELSPEQLSIWLQHRDPHICIIKKEKPVCPACGKPSIGYCKQCKQLFKMR